MFVAILVKTGSSLGRILIYKVSLEMLGDHPWFGIGLGNFQRDYLLYQAEYFEKGDFTLKELLLADNTYFAFNDYLQLVVEGGVPMIILLFFYIKAVIYSIVYAHANESQDKTLTSIAIFNIIAISVAAFFTHIFENPIWGILFLMSFLLLTMPLSDFKRAPFRTSILVICLILTYFGTKLVNNKYYLQYSQAQSLAAAGYHGDALENYKDLYAHLNADPWFLYNYGRFMLKINNPYEAMQLIERSKKALSFNNQYLDLGDCYFSLGNYDLAELHYLKSVHMVPNRFHNRFQLFNFYLATEQINKARICANEIHNLPVKVPSVRVTFIQQKIREFLKEDITVN